SSPIYHSQLSGTKTVQYVVGLTGVKECCTCKPFASSQKIQSTLMLAQKNGLSTGIVTNTRITHATPAACYAHSTDRSYEFDSLVSPSDSSFVCEDIASQLITNGLDFNVILAGGSRMFYQNASAVTPEMPGSRTDGKNLFEHWLREQQTRNRAHKLVFNAEELRKLNLSEIDHLLGES
ncbi:alkaline phosphatase, partial [Paragonimus westermani]